MPSRESRKTITQRNFVRHQALVLVAPPLHNLTMASMAIRRLLGCLLTLLMFRIEAGEALTIALPPQSDLTRLADLTAEFAGVSLQYHPQKLQGSVRLAVRGEVTQAELWEVFNQVLIGQGFTTVLTGLPPVYQVVPLTEAAGLGVALDPAQAAKIPYQPGYGVLVLTLKHLSAEAAVKSLSTLSSGNQVSQIRALGGQERTVIISGPRAVLRQAELLFGVIDRPGVVTTVRFYRPGRASAQTIQASATAAWTAMGRLQSVSRPVEIQVAPDGQQVLLIAATEDLPALEALVDQLDKSEPVETRSYRPRHFGIDEVAALLQQLLKPASTGAAGIEVVRDSLTNSLIVKATAEQHRRVSEILAGLDNAPPTSRRQVRTLPVKHRQADEVTKVLTGLIATGVVRPPAEAAPGLGASAPAGVPAAAPTGPVSVVQPLPATPLPAVAAHEAIVAGDQSVLLTADVITNSVIALGDPRALDQVETLLKQLDQRQPQVDLEVIMVSLNDAQSQTLGVELLGQITHGETSATVASLFGLSEAGTGDPLARILAEGATGFGGVVLRPGDFAGVVQALETVTDGRQLVRSKVVVNNNAKATIDGVLQESLVSSNSNGVSGTTTSVSGTSDAGTQITITPQISSADYVTVSYQISQSAFLGESTTTESGTRIPPTKRSDSVASIATVPDGSIIALGGLSNRGNGKSESRIPLLGSIPFFGALFRSRTVSESDSRFYVFIRVNVMRHQSFADLKRTTTAEAKEAKVDTGEPVLEPQFIR
jgi:general secretion pathway protein D